MMTSNSNHADPDSRSANASNAPRKRASISLPAQKYLLSESAGHCQNPICRRDLHAVVEGKVISEMAHIIPASADGPRGDEEPHLDDAARAEPSNILLLCPTCHTMIDRAVDDFPATLLRSWKRISQNTRNAAFGTPTFGSRAEARKYLVRMLDANYEIFSNYGPLEDSNDEDRAWMWNDLVKSNIIPNNAKIVAFVHANSQLLKASELALAAQFELHAQQFSSRHLDGNWAVGTIKFPVGFAKILEDAK